MRLYRYSIFIFFLSLILNHNLIAKPNVIYTDDSPVKLIPITSYDYGKGYNYNKMKKDLYFQGNKHIFSLNQDGNNYLVLTTTRFTEDLSNTVKIISELGKVKQGDSKKLTQVRVEYSKKAIIMQAIFNESLFHDMFFISRDGLHWDKLNQIGENEYETVDSIKLVSDDIIVVKSSHKNFFYSKDNGYTWAKLDFLKGYNIYHSLSEGAQLLVHKPFDSSFFVADLDTKEITNLESLYNIPLIIEQDNEKYGFHNFGSSNRLFESGIYEYKDSLYTTVDYRWINSNINDNTVVNQPENKYIERYLVSNDNSASWNVIDFKAILGKHHHDEILMRTKDNSYLYIATLCPDENENSKNNSVVMYYLTEDELLSTVPLNKQPIAYFSNAEVHSTSNEFYSSEILEITYDDKNIGKHGFFKIEIS